MKKTFSFFVITAEIGLIVFLAMIFYQKVFEVKVSHDQAVLQTSMPLVISFSQSMAHRNIEQRIKIDPKIEADLSWQDNFKKLTIMPIKTLHHDRTYQVTLDWGRSIFGTVVKDVVLDFKTAKAKKLFVHNLPQLKPTEKKIDINLKTQKMSLWQDGQMIGEYPVSTGKRSTPTLAGNFKVLTKLTTAYGCGDGQCWRMPYWLGFYTAAGSENGIHELPFIKSGNNWFREGQSSLGFAVSHGCVRLGIGNAELVYNFAATGTPVITHY